MRNTGLWKKIVFVFLMVALSLVAFKLGESLFSGRELRSPASTDGDYDFSNLSATDFKAAVKRRLVESADFKLNGSGQAVFDLGLFLGPERPVSACASFSDVVLTLKGEGIAVSGELPEIKVYARCDEGEQNRLRPIRIPFNEIFQMAAQDQQKLSFDAHDINVDFSHMSGEWAPEWFVSEIRLTNVDQSQEIVVTASDLRKAGRLLQVGF